MNRLELRNETRRRIAETSSTASYSTDTDINAYLNEGIRDMCVKGKVYERSLITTTVDSYATYSLPLDFISLRAVFDPPGFALDQIEPTGIGRLWIVSGKPQYYFISHYPLSIVSRQNDTIYSAGNILIPATPNGYMYEVSVGGMSDISEPTMPTVYGQPVVDNNATLVCRDLATVGYNITLYDTPTTLGGGVGNYAIVYYAMANGLYSDIIAPDFPEDKHHILVMFATFRHFVKCKDITKAKEHYSDYAGALGLKSGQVEG